jgi:hypothetical protein
MDAVGYALSGRAARGFNVEAAGTLGIPAGPERGRPGRARR